MPNEDLKRLMEKEKTGAPGETVDPAAQAASTEAKPNTETAENKFRVKMKIGGEERELTDDQIASTFERYRDLNFKHATYKPALDFIEGMAQESGKDPREVMKTLMEQLKGGKKPDGEQQQQQVDLEDDDETLSKWEQENGASLPPGYRNVTKGIKSVAQGQAQLMDMLKQVMNASKGVADAAKVAQVDARDKSIQSIKRVIGANLNEAQQKFGLPTEAVKDFMMFSSERGYSLEDFIDPNLTMKVASDFKNAMEGPELARIKEVAARRQAYTGSIGATPSPGPASGGDVPKDAIFDRLASKRR